MDAITLRSTILVAGKEKTFLWTFTPLRNQFIGYRYLRQSSEDGGGTPRRRPFGRREMRSVKIAAGVLVDDVQFQHLLEVLDAQKIEWQREVGGKKQWVEFTLDIEQDASYDTVEDIDRLHSFTMKLVQHEAVWYPDFKNAKVQFTDYRG